MKFLFNTNEEKLYFYPLLSAALRYPVDEFVMKLERDELSRQEREAALLVVERALLELHHFVDRYMRNWETMQESMNRDN
ncbi:hypothetical protein LX64_01151 [Chitinophaga skermanii]|uniref:Uncharacterized protein n=1 Tax=Chitinophaga skermanii TaxID=331697 RepID=A0A327QV61_9BACT|nr:hypothetical protein [Chitinophaga skermanii]RAJ08499.1 hypothetical protein LX64_01151 [Chitinophaga skermanii]